MPLQQIITSTINKFSFDHQTFAQIIKILNIPIDNIYEPNLISILQQKLKSKLNDIFLSQGRNYQDYLRLPKFSILKPQTKLKLTMLFDQIWKQYQTQLIRSNQNEYSQVLSYMLPQFRSLHQIENFHLQMFTQFRNNKFSKQNNPLPYRNIMQPPTQNTYPMPPVDPMTSGFHRPTLNTGIPPSFYPKIDSQFINNNSNMMGRIYGSMGNPTMNNPWIEQQHPQSQNIMQPSHLANNNLNSPFPIPHINQPNRSFFPLPKQHNIEREQNINNPLQKQPLPSKNISPPSEKVYQQNQSSIEEQGQQEKQSKLVHITGQDDEFQQKLKHYQFIECACQGNYKSQKYFQCKQCHFYFHFECLNMTEEHPVQICPCCKLKQGTNIFVKINPQVFGKRWCKMQYKQKLSMFLTQREIEKMREIKQNLKPNSILQYQLRFFKIPNKQLNPLGVNNTKNNINNRKPSLMNNNNDTRKFNNLPLPSAYIQKIQPYNVFQISLRPGEMKNSNNREEQQCLYIFGIFMIERYSEMGITQDLFENLNQQNSVGEEYLERYLIDPQEGIQIKMLDPTSQQPIRYPVRGEQCNHPQVFDCISILQYYKQYGEKLTQMHCPVCESEFKKMIVDRFLCEKLRENQALGKEYQKLKYYGSGRVQFLSEQQQPSQKSINYMNENQQRNQNNMQEQQKLSNSQNNDQDQSLSSEQENEDSPSLSC